MSLKRIEMDYELGMVYDIFQKACRLAVDHQCDQVVFEFNEGKFVVSRSTYWNDNVVRLLQSYPREGGEVKL